MRNCRTQNKSIKQYSTLEMLCKYKDRDGSAISLAGMTIKSDILSESGHMIDSLDVVVLDNTNGAFVMTPTIFKLPAGKINIDVIFIEDDRIITSDTFSIDVASAITNPDLRGVICSVTHYRAMTVCKLKFMVMLK